MGDAFYRGVDVCMLVFDITSEASFESLKKWRSECIEVWLLGSYSIITFLKQQGDKGRMPTFVVVGNKLDLENKRKVCCRDSILLVGINNHCRSPQRSRKSGVRQMGICFILRLPQSALLILRKHLQ